MKVEYVKSVLGYWYWEFGKATYAGLGYTRRRDAVRGFERFCAAIRRVK